MPPAAADRSRQHLVGQRGTASVELVAVIPFLLLALAGAAQIALAGEALWSAGVAARAGARAALVGRDPEAAARAALPSLQRVGSEVQAGSDGVRVRVPVLSLVPGTPSLSVGAGTELGEGGDDG